MTDEEIKKIAREYSNLNIPNGLKGDALVRSIAYNNEEMFADFLEWLSKDYCIVDRGVLKERYKGSELQSISNSRIDMVSGTSRMILLESIFGTELFNEEKEVDNA